MHLSASFKLVVRFTSNTNTTWFEYSVTAAFCQSLISRAKHNNNNSKHRDVTSLCAHFKLLTVMFVAVEDPHVTTVFVENGKRVGRRTKDEILEAQALADAMMFGWEGWRDETHVIVLARVIATSVHIDI